MRKLLLLLSVGLAAISCSKDDAPSFMSNGTLSRIVFWDAEEFISTYMALSEKGPDYQDEWLQTKTIIPLLDSLENCDDQEMLNMPRSFQALFNSDLEIQIRDTVIQYERGNLYVTNINGRVQNPRILYGTAQSFVLDQNGENGSMTRTHNFSFNWEGIGGSRQYEFSDPHTGGNKKYVNEFISSQIRLNGQYYRSLILIVKLEWKVSKWKEADEPRDVRIALTGTANANGVNLPINYFATVPMVQRNREFILAYSPLGSPSSNSWNVTVSGEIEQVMTGQITTKWIDFR